MGGVEELKQPDVRSYSCFIYFLNIKEIMACVLMIYLITPSYIYNIIYYIGSQLSTQQWHCLVHPSDVCIVQMTLSGLHQNNTWWYWWSNLNQSILILIDQYIYQPLIRTKFKNLLRQKRSKDFVSFFFMSIIIITIYALLLMQTWASGAPLLPEKFLNNQRKKTNIFLIMDIVLLWSKVLNIQRWI